MSRVRINQKEYAYGDIVVVMWGRPIIGLKGIEYKTKKEKKLNHGAGRDAYSIQHGKRENEGTLTITQSELEAMNAAARAKGYRDVLDVEFDLVVSYVPEDSVVIVIDKIVCASIADFGKGMKEGDMLSEHPLPFVCLDIDYDTKNPAN